MTEWTVVTALSVLIGLFVSLVRPLMRLNGTMTGLTDAVRALEKNLDAIAGHNSEAHARLWERSRAHDDALHDHETRLRLMEERE